MGDRLWAVAVAVPFLVGTLVGPASAAPAADVLFRFQDPEIVESSGLVAAGGRFATVNDSGDTGRVFVVDGRSGRTVGVTTWSESPVDVEALAPAGEGEVWVGDIGDNPKQRATIEVARVPLGDGARTVDPTTYSLTYPGGAVDAETLLHHPVTGRLYVASKVVLGGTLYEAPRQLSADRPNRLTEVGRVMSLATDGAFFPDGRHLVMRDYGRAVVYAFPSLQEVGSFDLPDVQQGEGIAVGDDGALYVSTEGRNSPVHRVPLPDSVAAAMAGDGASESAEPEGGETTAAPVSGEPQQPDEFARERPAWPWFLTGWIGLAALVGLAWVFRRR